MERYDFKTQRLYVENPLAKEVSIKADRSQANYLRNVLRLTANSKILLFNGRDGEWLARVQPTGRRDCELICEKRLRAQPEKYKLQYLFAPLKQGRLDYMVQKAVEMGAGTLRPVITQHTQVSKPNLHRMRANVIEAAEQCGILTLPTIENPIKLQALLSEWDQETRLFFCDESAEEENVVDRLSADRPARVAVLIGPEGGFSSDERELLRSHDFVTPLSLGPRILRADTAGVAALAIVQATIGDW